MHYILSRQRIEGFATEILNDYNPDFLKTPQPLDVYGFAENYMELQVDFKNLSNDGTVLGLTSFNDGKYLAWNDDRTKQYPILVQNGTIIIENALLENRFPGREHFTAIHECAHQILHKECFKMSADISGSGIVSCVKRDIEPERTNQKRRTSKEWIEWQANALAAALLMPTEMVKQVFLKNMNIEPEDFNEPIKLNFWVELGVFEAAQFFKVSHQAMKIRLLQLGLLQERSYNIEDFIAASK